MGRYQEKVLRGEVTDPSDWVEYLRESHEIVPSMTPKAFESPRSPSGKNSYQTLIEAAKRRFSQPKRILDLACGDGHLLRYIQAEFGSSIQVIGVDMSERELEVARAKDSGSNVVYKREMADAISEPDQSIDIVFCHMALMLMNPVQPVVREVARLLRPGGVFVGVVSGSVKKERPSDLFSLYVEQFHDFMARKFPSFQSLSGVDPRARSPEGLKELLTLPLLTPTEVSDFAVIIRASPEKAWSFFEDMYNVSLLPQPERDEFRDIIISCAERECRQGAELEFEFPLRLFIAERE